MVMNEVLLSTGSIPWCGLKNSIGYAKDVGFDGIEIVPSRRIIKEARKIIIKSEHSWTENPKSLNSIRGLHQSWRLDIGLDKSYDIKFPMTVLFSALRLILFPGTEKSNGILKLMSENLDLPVVVHNLSDKWTKDDNHKEFPGGILYEMIGMPINQKILKNWLRNEHHNIVIDSRDDQSLKWAKQYGFKKWQKFWTWLGIKKIKNYQLTFIGAGGLRKIIKHEKSLAEEQLLWLHENKWQGHVTVEANPLMLFFLLKGNINKGLFIINQFIRHTLKEGKRWSD